MVSSANKGKYLKQLYKITESTRRSFRNGKHVLLDGIQKTINEGITFYALTNEDKVLQSLRRYLYRLQKILCLNVLKFFL